MLNDVFQASHIHGFWDVTNKGNKVIFEFQKQEYVYKNKREPKVIMTKLKDILESQGQS